MSQGLFLESLAEKLTDWLRAQSGSLTGALTMGGNFIRDTVGVLDRYDAYPAESPKYLALIEWAQKLGYSEVTPV